MGRPRKNAAVATAPKKVASLPGLQDVLAETDLLWNGLTRRFAKVARTYGFERIETPLLEHQNLYENFYKKSPADMVELLTMSLLDMPLVVRPAMLPSVLRAYAQHKVFEATPLSKWYYEGMVAKKSEENDSLIVEYEFGLEVLGSFSHLTEAQTVAAVWELFQSLGFSDAVLEINNIGSPSCQAVYEESLADFLSSKKYELCDECNEHLKGRVLNVFRCQNLDCQAVVSEAPAMLDFLDQDSNKHFTAVLEALDELGIPYQLNAQYVGPAGFSKTNIGIKYKVGDRTISLGEAGYHETLMQQICGKPHNAFGFKGSFTQLRQLLEQAKATVAKDQKNDVLDRKSVV